MMSNALNKTATAPATGPVLAVENLRTSFLVDGAWKPVVRDISFTVMPGETVASRRTSPFGTSMMTLTLPLMSRKTSSARSPCRKIVAPCG